MKNLIGKKMKKIIILLFLISNFMFSEKIHDLIIKGDLIGVKKILKKNPEKINAIDNSKLPGGTPLNFAVYNMKLNILKLLVDFSAKVNIEGIEGNTSIFWAMYTNNIEIMKILVSNGANLNFKNKSDDSPILYILKKTPVNIIKYLVENGADYNVCDEFRTPLKQAVISKNKEVEKYLRSIGAVSPDDLYDAVIIENLPKIKSLLKKAPCMAKSILYCGKSIIHLAAERGNIDIVRYLLNIGISPNLRDTGLVTPLHLASLYGEKRIVKLLFNSGAKVLSDEDGRTPLTYLTGTISDRILSNLSSYYSGKNVKKEYLEIAKILISQEADVNSRDLDGKTNLYYAIISNQVEMVKLLLQNKAILKNIDGKGHNALEIARREKVTNIEKLIKTKMLKDKNKL